MIYLGIDVGKSGALAVIYDNGLEITAEAIDFNDPKLVYKLNNLASNVTVAYIEKVSSMPNQGVASTFSFGTNYGWWHGVMDTLGIPYELVRPQEWMKSLSLPKNAPTKDAAIKTRYRKERKVAISNIARRLFPKVELVTQRGKILDGRSDALMIANYARKVYGK